MENNESVGTGNGSSACSRDPITSRATLFNNITVPEHEKEREREDRLLFALISAGGPALGVVLQKGS